MAVCRSAGNGQGSLTKKYAFDLEKSHGQFGGMVKEFTETHWNGDETAGEDLIASQLIRDFEGFGTHGTPEMYSPLLDPNIEFVGFHREGKCVQILYLENYPASHAHRKSTMVRLDETLPQVMTFKR